jgi:hypothetical protein
LHPAFQRGSPAGMDATVPASSVPVRHEQVEKRLRRLPHTTMKKQRTSFRLPLPCPNAQ